MIEPRELKVGELFAERYSVESLLGRGGMASVYRARDMALGEPIALKILSLGEDPSPVAVLRFRQEVLLARRVTHPNVARVYDLGEEPGIFYLTMELVEGATLRAMLRSAIVLPAPRAIAIAKAIAEGLAAAHSAGVVHRDVKPSNILIAESGRVVVTDFGIARSLTDAAELTIGAIGTPAYMAPEQAVGAAIDERADVYALGLVLFEMLTGATPERDRAAAASRIRSRAEIPGELVDLVLSCIAIDPAQRPRSAAVVATTLARLQGDDARCEKQGDEVPTVAMPTSRSDRTRPEAPNSTNNIPSLAVLPFRMRGPEDEAYLGEEIAAELVDMLSRTRGLRVYSIAATRRFQEERDPRAIARALDVFAVVDGAVQHLGDGKLRITSRLYDADGVQLFSERHDCALEDVLDVDETIAKRVAEELRIELSTLANRGDAPPEALSAYFDARRRLRVSIFMGSKDATEAFDRCLALAPGFRPAIAGRAVAAMRVWFYSEGANEPEAKLALDAALDRAPELPETQLAAGMFHTQRGEFEQAANALKRALQIAPTFADALEYMGQLEIEADSPRGVRRMLLADSLDPSLTLTRIHLARHAALNGDWTAAFKHLDEAERRGAPAFSTTRLRLTAWRGDRAALEELVARGSSVAAVAPILVFARAILEGFPASTLRAYFERFRQNPRPARFQSFFAQLIAEVHATLGHVDEALEAIAYAADCALIDLGWLRRCPALESVRARPAFADIVARVKIRVAPILAN